MVHRKAQQSLVDMAFWAFVSSLLAFEYKASSSKLLMRPAVIMYLFLDSSAEHHSSSGIASENTAKGKSKLYVAS